MEVNEAVAKIANAYEEAESAAQHISTVFANCKDAWEALRDNGVIGGLEMQMRYRRLKAIGAALQAEIYTCHADDTAKGQDLNIDLPQPRSGGR